MTHSDPKSSEVLRIGHETSMRGAGLSLREALRRVRYDDQRSHFEPADLRPLLGADPELSETWLAYSEDKRTIAGWCLLRSGEIGQVGNEESRRHFDTLEEAVAEYVVRELDFWAGFQRAGQQAASVDLLRWRLSGEALGGQIT